MKVAIFGDDLVGLVTAASLAEVGNDVLCVPLGSFKKQECNEKLINDEPGLTKLVDTQLRARSLAYEVTWDKLMQGIDVVFISLPSKCLDVADEIISYIANNIKEDLVIVNQCSFEIGTADKFELSIQQKLLKRNLNYNVSVVAMPAFISEGEAIKNFTNPDRILLGSDNNKAIKIVSDLMHPFNRMGNQIQVMSTRAAEYSKFAVNALLATRMSLINEMANIADGFNIDFEQVKQALGSDKRIGFNYINPGCGFGGPNFATDVEKLVTSLAEQGHEIPLLQKVLENNESQKEVLFRKAWQYFYANLKGKTFAVWGLSFKPGTSTVENGSSIKTIESLVAQGANVVVYDPKAMESFKLHWDGAGTINYAEDMYQALENVDALLLMTEWKQFRSPNFSQMKSLMKNKVIFDGRNIFDPGSVTENGFEYFGVGRGKWI